MITKRLVIKGKVQGVSFRASMHEFIMNEFSEKVRGFVRNLENGDVESVIQSEDQTAIDKIILWSKKGPKFAKVDEVKVSDLEMELLQNPFEIRK